MGFFNIKQGLARLFGGRHTGSSVNSFINREIVVQGDIQLQESGIHIDGQIIGNIIDYSEKARVVVGRTGVVRGSITAGYLVLLGRIEGNVLCKHFEIFGDAMIEGDIQYQTIAMHSGRIAGRLLPYPLDAKELNPSLKNEAAEEVTEVVMVEER